MQCDQALKKLLTPWGRNAPRTIREIDGLVDQFTALKERHPQDIRIDGVLRELGVAMRDHAARSIATLVAAH